MRIAAALLLALALPACATTGGTAAHHPEAKEAFTTVPGDDAMARVDAALQRAAASNRKVLLVMGANWCHDSRAFAGWTETGAIGELVRRAYEPVFVNVGMPQTGDAHNVAIAHRFGIEALEGTPTVLVLDPDGTALNLDTAPTWRNAASRSEAAILAELERLAAL